MLVIWEKKNKKQETMANFLSNNQDSLESMKNTSPANLGNHRKHLQGSQAGLTSVLVKVGACNRAPPELKVFLIHHHFPWLFFAP